MSHFEKTASVIVVSDIHLGDKYGRTREFYNFLSSIIEDHKNGRLPDFQVLVILGDFFDFIWRSIENLCENNEFIEIYALLQTLKYDGIDIILVLGNHEIATWGFYNLLFEKRKKEFLEKLRVNGFHFSFLNEISTCQYIVLGKNKRDETVLSLFDSKHDVKFNAYNQIISESNNREISLKHDAFTHEYCYFMTHGYQFADWIFHHFVVAPIWGSLIGDNIERGVLNELYYEIRNRFDDITTENIKRVASEKRIDISQFSPELLMNDLTKIEKRLSQEGSSVKNEVYHKNIIQYINTDQFKPVTHVIFGHSHESDVSRFGNLTILNSGCWITDKDPSYIEINIDGTSKVKSI